MAQQHFYSRVPAKMSIFNRTDSFDTFAHSEGLEDEFMEKELSAIYDNKPSKNDAVLIRNGSLPPVYCQLFTKSGVFAQGCISYLPLDYTGERSSYLAHTLIPSEEEAKALLENADNAPLNPEMFAKDLSAFDLTSFDASPDEKYPIAEYVPIKADSTAILSKYDSAMMKRLIFAMLNLACGKGKTIFISLPYQISEFSAKALQFINTLIQIFPYSLRKCFSFVTYTDDAIRYGSYNIRFIPENSSEIPPSKGMTLHFGSKISLGLSDEQVAANVELVEFYYSLIANDGTRREFLYYMDKAVQAVPELKKCNLKTMTELVFLFQQCSGLFNEKVILPNDAKMYDYVCAYEKHRAALSNENRAVAFKCLQRYPQTHQPIPKDVFTKISKIYPSEPIASKRNIMNVVLELIHTDVMREKLFAFIKSSYAGEDADIRSTICNNLCRVYYGGFLQPQILGFFEQYFSTESENTKNLIVEKLLLTIRTESVRAKIIAFFEKNYDELTEEQKNKLYDTCYEMLPHCDNIAADTVQMINTHIVSESDERKNTVGDKIFALAEANQRCKVPKLLPLLIGTPGFCSDTVTKKIFTQCSEKKIFAAYTKAYNELPVQRKLSLYDEIWKNVPDMSSDIATQWAEQLCDLYKEFPEGESLDLYGYLAIYKTFSEHSDTPAEKAFLNIALDNLVHPGIEKTLTQVFSVKRNPKGLAMVIECANQDEKIKSIPSYAHIQNYIDLIDSAKEGKHSKMFDAAQKLCDRQIHQGAAEHMKTELLETNFTADGKTELFAEVLYEYIKNLDFDFNAPYTNLKNKTAQSLSAENPKISSENAEAEASKKAVEMILEAANEIYTYLPEETRQSFVAPTSSLGKIINSYLSVQKKGKKVISDKLSIGTFDAQFVQNIKALVSSSQPASGGLFSRIFGKK